MGARYQVEVDGAVRSVELLRVDGDAVVARVDDREVRLERTALPTGEWLVRADGRAPRRLDCVRTESGWEVLGAGLRARVAVRDERDTWLRGGVAGAAERTITVSMPGRVVVVDVRPGQAVSAGDRLLVIEAMKMENDVRSPRDGVVRAIHVEPGGAVAGGQPLVELE